MSKKEKKNGFRPGVIIGVTVGVVLIFACVIIGAYFLLGNKKVETKAEGNGSGNIVITKDSRNSASDIAQKVKDGMIVVKMTGKWTFNKDCSSSDAYLANSTRNKYPLKFKVTLKDTGKVLFTTDEVPVGSSLEKFGLPEKLDVGTYDIIIEHQLVKEGKVASSVSTAATLVVK